MGLDAPAHAHAHTRAGPRPGWPTPGLAHARAITGRNASKDEGADPGQFAPIRADSRRSTAALYHWGNLWAPNAGSFADALAGVIPRQRFGIGHC
jgi:hypothetical protein